MKDWTKKKKNELAVEKPFLLYRSRLRRVCILLFLFANYTIHLFGKLTGFFGCFHKLILTPTTWCSTAVFERPLEIRAIKVSLRNSLLMMGVNLAKNAKRIWPYTQTKTLSMIVYFNSWRSHVNFGKHHISKQ